MLPSIKKILYATDLSESSRHVIRYAVSLGRTHQAEVSVLTVLPDVMEDMSEAAGLDLEAHFGVQAVASFRDTALARTRQELQRRIEETAQAVAVETPGEPLFAPTLLVEQGDPATRILELSEGYDVVVMGTHGKGGLLGRLLGSVAERVIRHSRVPVLVVRLPEPAGE